MKLAKLTQPKSINTIARPRLFRLLDKASRKPVTWIWAPPGSGKTTLVASYLAARKLRGLWYQIDGGDNDLATFFYYVGLGAPRRKRPMPLFTPEYQRGLSVFSRNFFRELFGRFKRSAVLVFDNYQEIAPDSPVHVVLQEALAERPARVRVVFISRGEPSESFAFLRSKQAIEMLDWDEIKFTRPEVMKLVRTLAPGRWPKRAIEQLFETADGWAAGLVLLLEQLRKNRATTIDADDRSAQLLFDYFAGEIFKKLDQESKEVLLQTSVLPSVSPRMAEELSGTARAGEILVMLHRQNYFTNRRESAELIYEYHPLFRGFLLQEAEETYAPDRLAEIRRKAGVIVEAAGQIETAAALFCAIGDHNDLAGLICRNAPALLAQGRNQTLEEWLAILPEAFFEVQPWLLYWRGLCRLGYRYADCRRDCERAFAAFRERGDSSGIFLTWALLVTSCIFGGDTRAMDPWIELLDTLTQEIPEFPSREIETHVAAAMFTAIATRRPDRPDGAFWAERALMLARKQTDLFLKVKTCLNWLVYHFELGNIAKAELVLEELSTITNDTDTPPIYSMEAAFGVGWYEALSALPSYKVTVARTLGLANQAGFEPIKYAMLMVGLIGTLSDGDLGTARPWLDLIARNRDKAPPLYSFLSHWMDVWGALIMNDLPRAIKGQPEMLQAGLRDGWPINNIVACLLSAHVLFPHNREAAWSNLDRAHEIARIMRSSLFEFMARLTEAHLHFEDGSESEGRRALNRAMVLGKAGNFVNTFTWLPKVMTTLCAKALEAGIEVDYVKMLIRRRKLTPEGGAVDLHDWPWPVKIYTLGKFEVLLDGKPLAKRRKAPHRLLDFLKTLIAFGAIDVPAIKLMDTLWPHTEGDAAKENLDKTLQRLRHLLGHDQILPVKGARVSLNPAICWTDAQAFERLTARAGEYSDHRSLSQALELYRGPFLAEEGDESWIDVTRERLRRKYRQTVFALADSHERGGRPDCAIECLQKAVAVDPVDESLVFRLMMLLVHANRRPELIDVYDQYCSALTAEIGATPSARIEKIFRQEDFSGETNEPERLIPGIHHPR
ncbi:MAG TPA: BTAD domain-containing putative transcriptional regulator [Candidatus Binatia bacterium]